MSDQTTPYHPRLCLVGRTLRALDEEDADALTEALDADWRLASAPAIARSLTAAGHPMTAGTVMRHRRGECGCSGAGDGSHPLANNRWVMG